jgi:hypothetical protein
MKQPWLLLAIALGLSGAALACRSEGGATAGCPGVESASPPIDAPVMAFLSAARALHHQADVREAEGDVPGAIAALERLVGLVAPRAIEVDEVLADARARLAELRMDRGDVEGAEHDVEQGLARVQGPTYFRGHLLEVQGRAEEKRAATLADAGHSAEAAKTRARAVSLLEEAVHVQEQVIEHALADGGARE